MCLKESSFETMMRIKQKFGIIWTVGSRFEVGYAVETYKREDNHKIIIIKFGATQ